MPERERKPIGEQIQDTIDYLDAYAKPKIWDYEERMQDGRVGKREIDRG